jgi:CTP-dependent riboflavin kinase
VTGRADDGRDPLRLTGTLRRGLGEATGFTALDWVRRAFRDRLGIDPHPGTVNLALESAAARAAWAAVKRRPPVVVRPPDPAFCDAHCYRARILGPAGAAIAAAIVIPQVAGYPPDQVELIASVGVRDALGLSDGDPVTVAVDGAVDGAVGGARDG